MQADSRSAVTAKVCSKELGFQVKKTRPVSSTADAKSINRNFIYLRNESAVSWFPDECASAICFFSEVVFILI